jgi:putative ABC transport system ATP-binding protein
MACARFRGSINLGFSTKKTAHGARTNQAKSRRPGFLPSACTYKLDWARRTSTHAHVALVDPVFRAVPELLPLDCRGCVPSEVDNIVLMLTDVSKSYNGARPRKVLHGVSLALEAGEYVAIMGESGVGKSTLLHLIAGLDRPDSGRILFDGQDLATLDDKAATLLRRRKLGFVFQAFHVLPNLSAGQNVALPLLLNGFEREKASARVAEMLAAVGLEGREDSMPRELSGGELQRVAIARALVHRPMLLLADEPTGNLDYVTAARVLRLLRGLVNANGTAAILVTHSAVAAAAADRVLQLTPSGLAPPGPPPMSGPG